MKKKFIAIVLVCCVMCFGALALSACGGGSGSASSSVSQVKQDKEITMSEYEAIQDGMTYAQVVEVVGCEGTEQSSSNIDAGSNSIKTIMYTWEGNGGPGSNANVTIQNDKVVSKAQIGLK